MHDAADIRSVTWGRRTHESIAWSDVVTWVYDFEEGNRDLKGLLGGKGANLAEMTRLGLPVPPGFTVTTEACNHYLETGSFPEGLWEEVLSHVRGLESRTGRRFGDPGDPLLVSVRSGSPISMPGMMDTILDLGLNGATVEGLAAVTGDRRFALDSYRRFVQMFATTARGLDGNRFESRLYEARSDAVVGSDSDLDTVALYAVVEDFLSIYEEQAGEPFPDDPELQLRTAIEAVFRSWEGRPAREYRALNDIPDDLGTAVNVQAMVFGNRGPGSGTGVAFTRNPNTGERDPLIDFLPNAQGEDVVAGIRRTEDGAAFGAAFPEQAGRLRDAMRLLEEHEGDACDLEFTIEDGRLWLLQVRRAKRTALAAVRIAQDLVHEGRISEEEALLRVTPEQIELLLHPRFDPDADYEVIAKGVAASPGAATGIALFDTDEAAERGRGGERIILVREMTSPEDLHGMAVSQGILTAQGGNLSHAAIVAKSMGLPAVCGAEIEIDDRAREFRVDGVTVREGDVISIDGTIGQVAIGEVPVVVPEGEAQFGELLVWADRRARLVVRANADSGVDCRRARDFGAMGVGLCRTEHMFLGDRLPALRRYIMSTGTQEATSALAEIRDQQRNDFVEILEAMDGLPVTIRLLDPPLHEFLPSLEELVVREATGDATAEELHDLPIVRNLHEENPMLGFRGCRLGVVHPDLYEMQVEAVAEAVLQRVADGGRPKVEIMVPLVADAAELALLRRRLEDTWRTTLSHGEVEMDVGIGTMIEVPRAALVADRIAEEAEFFSFGTNDLTQMTWAFSRDDAEGHYLADYIEKGVLRFDPFETLDVDGVGALIEIAVERGRSVRPDLALGLCGEHGGDPDSIAFCHAAGLDYVSCSPFRVPAARLAAAQVTLAEKA